MTRLPHPVHTLRLGVVTDSEARGQLLRDLVRAGGHHIAAVFLAPDTAAAHLLAQEGELDVWLLDVDFDQSGSAHLHIWLEQSTLPLVVTDGETQAPGSAACVAWLRRLDNKLQQLQGQLNLSAATVRAAPELWILGASTGGPQAVREFVDALPARLGVAFIYAQHIDAGFEKNLQKMLAASHYPAFIARHGDVLQPDTIAILRSDEWLEVLENGTLRTRSQGWAGCYRPSIDQVMTNVARYWRGRCGAIIFSGMGDDGARGARHLALQGHPVWVQTPSSCTLAAMPEAVLDSGCVSFSDTPAALARALAAHIMARARGPVN